MTVDCIEKAKPYLFVIRNDFDVRESTCRYRQKGPLPFKSAYPNLTNRNTVNSKVPLMSDSLKYQ